MPLIDESENPEVPLPLDPPPPPAVLPKLTGVIADAVQGIREGKSLAILVHEKTQDNKVNATHIVFGKRIGENFVATGWVGREWNKPGTVGFGAAMVWELD